MEKDKKPKKCLHKFVSAGSFEFGQAIYAQMGNPIPRKQILFCEKCGEVKSATV